MRERQSLKKVDFAWTWKRDWECTRQRIFCTYVLCLNEIQREGERFKISVSRVYERGTKRELARICLNSRKIILGPKRDQFNWWVYSLKSRGYLLDLSKSFLRKLETTFFSSRELSRQKLCQIMTNLCTQLWPIL